MIEADSKAAGKVDKRQKLQGRVDTLGVELEAASKAFEQAKLDAAAAAAEAERKCVQPRSARTWQARVASD